MPRDNEKNLRKQVVVNPIYNSDEEDLQSDSDGESIAGYQAAATSDPRIVSNPAYDEHCKVSVSSQGVLNNPAYEIFSETNTYLDTPAKKFAAAVARTKEKNVVFNLRNVFSAKENPVDDLLELAQALTEKNIKLHLIYPSTTKKGFFSSKKDVFVDTDGVTVKKDFDKIRKELATRAKGSKDLLLDIQPYESRQVSKTSKIETLKSIGTPLLVDNNMVFNRVSIVDSIANMSIEVCIASFDLDLYAQNLNSTLNEINRQKALASAAQGNLDQTTDNIDRRRVQGNSEVHSSGPAAQAALRGFNILQIVDTSDRGRGDSSTV
jgi:hypothetical protein